jgi:hypothetical protein
MEFEDIVLNVLDEGVHDKNRFKAIFVLGPPGAGKSYITKNYITDGSLKLVDNDVATVHLLKKHGLADASSNNFDFTEYTPEQEQKLKDLRKKAWDLTGGGLTSTTTSGSSKGLLQQYVQGGLGIIYSGSGANAQDQKVVYDYLVKNGYDVMCVIVSAPLGVCLQGNRNRDRKIKDSEIISKHTALEQNLPFYKSLFKNNYVEFENIGRGSRDETPQELQQLVDKVKKFLQ